MLDCFRFAARTTGADANGYQYLRDVRKSIQNAFLVFAKKKNLLATFVPILKLLLRQIRKKLPL
jgi:hypothetical protein